MFKHSYFWFTAILDVFMSKNFQVDFKQEMQNMYILTSKILPKVSRIVYSIDAEKQAPCTETKIHLKKQQNKKCKCL